MNPTAPTGNHRKSITEVHQLGRREGAPRPGHEPTPSPRAGHLTGSGHLLPMRGGGNWWSLVDFSRDGDVTQKAWGFPWESGDLKLCGDRMGDNYRIFWDGNGDTDC